MAKIEREALARDCAELNLLDVWAYDHLSKNLKDYTKNAKLHDVFVLNVVLKILEKDRNIFKGIVTKILNWDDPEYKVGDIFYNESSNIPTRGPDPAARDLQRAGARHVLRHQSRIAGDVLAHVARQRAGIDVVAAARRETDQHLDGAALVEVLHRIGGHRLRRGGDDRRRGCGEHVPFAVRYAQGHRRV